MYGKTSAHQSSRMAAEVAASGMLGLKKSSTYSYAGRQIPLKPAVNASRGRRCLPSPTAWRQAPVELDKTDKSVTRKTIDPNGRMIPVYVIPYCRAA